MQLNFWLSRSPAPAASDAASAVLEQIVIDVASSGRSAAG